jgi:hypothetical protein
MDAALRMSMQFARPSHLDVYLAAKGNSHATSGTG